MTKIVDKLARVLARLGDQAMNAQYEFCDVCDWATGRAGRGDDSLYVTDCDGNEIGPLCEIC